MSETNNGRWQDLLDSWDRQQGNYLHDREDRFRAMLDAVAAVVSADRFAALDLCSGPGAVSRRLLDRFPQAAAVAVDFDPVMLALGQNAIGTVGDRLRWVEADLRDVDWPTALGADTFDVVLSTTALHGMEARDLLRVYRDVHGLLSPHGVFLNGDRMPFRAQHITITSISEGLKKQRQDAAFARAGAEDLPQWWKRVATEMSEELPLAEHEQRMAGRLPIDVRPSIDLHLAALYEAGFAEVDVLWQNLDNRVLIGVR